MLHPIHMLLGYSHHKCSINEVTLKAFLWHVVFILTCKAHTVNFTVQSKQSMLCFT